jgi:hypothetical protein
MAERHFLDIMVRADAGDYDIGIPSRRGGRRRKRSPVTRDPVARTVGGPVINHERVARGSEVPGHRSTHHAKPDKCYSCHGHEA